MTRLTWTSGDKATPQREVDSEAFTLRTAWERVLKLIGLVSDLAHGANTPPIVLDASGTAAKGCPLGAPLGQELRPPIAYTASATTSVYLAIAPIYVPDGETEIRVEMDHAPSLRSYNLKLQVLDPSDLSVVEERTPNRLDNSPSPAWCHFDGLTSGSVYLVAARADQVNGQGGTNGALRVFFPRLGARPAPAPDNAVTNDVSLSTKAGATSAVIADIVDLDSTWIASEYPIDARSVDAAARNLATLDEEILARPAMGANSAYTLASSTGDTDPADDAFLSGSRSVYTAEPVYDLPALVCAAGVCPTDGGLGAALGVVTDDARPPGAGSNTAGGTNMSLAAMWFPDLAAVSGGVALRVKVLWYSPDDSVTGGTSTPSTRVRAYDEAVATIATTTQAHTSWTTPATRWHLSTCDLADWNEDNLGMLGVGYNTSLGNLKSTAGDSLRLAGWCAYFVKT